LVANLIFVLSQATYEMVLFVFGGQKRRGQIRRVFRAGLAWMQLVWLQPLLDWALGLPIVSVSPEDGNALGPLHLAASLVIYAWPVLVCVLSIRHSRWRLSDLPANSRETLHLVRGLHVAGAVMGFIIVSLASNSTLLYQLGQVLLMGFLLVWYWIMMRNPQALARMRRVVHDNHERRIGLDNDEAQIITERLEALVRQEVFRRPELSLAVLAGLIRMPAYRLSQYFNQHLDSTFPVWLNKQRIAWVCGRMKRRPDQSILDLATDAGYGSKTAFNTQFTRIMNMNPSEYRKQLFPAETADRAAADER
jgi:AraC-like DNA-binding protein